MRRTTSSPFGGETRTRVLVALGLLETSYARELARLLAAPASGVRKAIAALENEVDVLREISAAGVQVRAGAAGENGPDAVLRQCAADSNGDATQRRAGGDLHRGLPACRGRRRNFRTSP